MDRVDEVDKNPLLPRPLCPLRPFFLLQRPTLSLFLTLRYGGLRSLPSRRRAMCKNWFVAATILTFSVGAWAETPLDPPLTPSMTASPASALIDEEVALAIRDLLPFEVVQIRAETEDAQGEKWSSSATFQADELGKIQLDSTELLWSLQPASKKSSCFKSKGDFFVIQLSLLIKDKLVATRELSRFKKSLDIQKKTFKEKGTLFFPRSEDPLPVIITLSSDGGICEGRAQLLASHGFATLALDYVGDTTLENISLGDFAEALEWLKTKLQIADDRIGIYGVSGEAGEFSLVLGSVEASFYCEPTAQSWFSLGETPQRDDCANRDSWKKLLLFFEKNLRALPQN